MRYRAWRRDRHDSGLTEYRSSTLVKGVDAQYMNQLYLDDENRLSWDFCFKGYEMLEDEGKNGDIVRWIRKFPVCAIRDYILARRCFRVGENLYTITRSTEHPLAPRREKPHRVDRFYSSWVCRTAQWDIDDGDFGMPVSE